MTNFQGKAFDDATQLKLDIYREYIQEWLPVFIETWNGDINIFDFFSGPGQDSNAASGSPLIAINSCKKFVGSLTNKQKRVHIFFSDSKKKNISQLDEILRNISLPDQIRVKTTNESFNVAFMRQLKQMNGAANLIFMDQCGIKEVTSVIFKELIALNRTDFLFFISSSYFKRFRESEEFKNRLDVTGYISSETNFSDSHRLIASYYRSLVPVDSKYYVAPFSLKKGSNIYGLVFGSSNLLGIQKFLRICWKIDPERGEANFDIDEDALPGQNDNLDLFRDNVNAKKVTNFHRRLEERLLAGHLKSDKDVFIFALQSGFIPTKHAKEIVIKLISQKSLACSGQPRLSKICLKEPRSIVKQKPASA